MRDFNRRVICAALLLGSASVVAAQADPIESDLPRRIGEAKEPRIDLSPQSGQFREPSVGIIVDVRTGALTREPLQFPDTIAGTDHPTEYINAVRFDLPVTPPNPRIVMIMSAIAGTNWRCTGSIIHPQIVLTAGHCVYKGAYPSSVRVIPGYAKGQGITGIGAIEGVKVATFSGWVEGNDNAHDIGLIQLKQRVEIPGYPPQLSGGECNADAPRWAWDRITYDAAHNNDETQFTFNNLYRGCTKGTFWHALPTDQGSSGSPALMNGQIYGVNSARSNDGRFGFDARITQGKFCFAYMKFGDGAICYRQ